MPESNKDKEGAGSARVPSSQEQNLAQAALEEFTKENYAGALDNLQKLETTWSHDYRLTHNKAVIEFFMSGQKNSDQFLKSLSAVRPQACYSGEECIGLEQVEQCPLYYNYAVLFFHLRKYNLALNIIKQVFTFIEPMEESLVHKVCLLLLELLLCLRRVDEALEYVSYIITQFASTKKIEVLEEPTEKLPVVFDAATDEFRRKLLQYKTRCFLLAGYAVGAQRELASLDTAIKDPTTLFLMAHVEYQKNECERAVELLSMAQTASMRPFVDTGVSLPFLFNNNMGCVLQRMGKTNLAAFYFKKALQDNEEICRQFPRNSPRPIYTIGGHNVAQLMYNIGVCQLFVKKPLQAFDFLLQAAQVFHLNPRLWLRMAEACIMAHKEGNEEEFAMYGRRKDVVAGVVGAGAHRKLLLVNKKNDPDCGGPDQASPAIPAPTLEFAYLCLKNALTLLPLNVEGERKDNWVSPTPTPTHNKKEMLYKDQKPGARNSMYGAPSVLLSDSEVQALRVSTLVSSSYVALCLGDYTPALNYAETLLREPRVPGAHRTLAHLYAADALIQLDRVAEAIEHLNPDHVIDLEIALPPPGSDSNLSAPTGKRDWYPDKALTGKIVMQFNMAAAFAIKGDLDKAGELLKYIWSLKTKADIPLQIVMLALYIELQLGHTENARSILKQHCPLLR